eukprot:scaffold1338_cov63-Phaeocystis_antarctica.AAC.8
MEVLKRSATKRAQAARERARAQHLHDERGAAYVDYLSRLCYLFITLTLTSPSRLRYLVITPPRLGAAAVRCTHRRARRVHGALAPGRRGDQGGRGGGAGARGRYRGGDTARGRGARRAAEALRVKYRGFSAREVPRLFRSLPRSRCRTFTVSNVSGTPTLLHWVSVHHALC